MDDLFYERACAIALNRIFGYEPRFSFQLISAVGSAKAVFELTEDELYVAFGPHSKYRDKIRCEEVEKSVTELEHLQNEGYKFISVTEDCFPMLLKECPDCPCGLYVRSESEPESIFNTGPAIAVVGTRDISEYGKEWCPRIVRALASAEQRPTIVSGLAFGVDISAHLAAVAYGLPTIAVLPTGITDVYPTAHRVAAGKIATAPGSALITDYPPGTVPLQVNFLRRNRIIAGMSTGTILVESKKKGGGTMTARLAASYGRDVFALPGRIGDIRSEGCNLLIGEKLAEPITSGEALVDNLGLGKYSERKNSCAEDEIRRLHPEGPEPFLKFFTAIRQLNKVLACRPTPDDICRHTGLSYADTISSISVLEEDGILCTDLLQRCGIADKFR